MPTPDSDALTFRCSNCGAPNAGTAQSCEYCRAPLTTRRCGHCFDHSPATARHCSGCGRELGLEPIAEPSELPCPACRTPLAALVEAAGALYDCSRCGGHFVEHALLRSLIEQRAALALNSPTAPERRRHSLADKVSYRPCARCNAMMLRKNFGDASGVIVDVCAKHGIWFDAGELPAVLDFVERGGLERARARSEERARQARIEERAARSATFTNLEAEDARTQGWLDFIASLLTF